MKSFLIALLFLLPGELALAQAHLVKDINTSPADFRLRYDGSNPFVNVGNYVAFPLEPTIATASGVVSLWITDGTDAGTRKVYTDKNAKPGPARFFANLNGSLMYIDDNGIHPQLRKYDPVAGQSSLVKEFDHDINMDVIRSGDVLIFSSPGETTTELWKSDGTEEGTVMFKTIPLATSPYGSVYKKASDGGSYSYFILFPKDGFKLSLWRTDGTGDGTILLKDSEKDFDPNYSELYAKGNEAWIGLGRSTPGSFFSNEWWKSDGTVPGTGALTTTIGPVSEFTTARVGSRMMTSAFREICVSDGTPAGTQKIDTETIMMATEYKGLYYFIGIDNNYEKSYLAKSDGSEAGTVKVIDLTDEDPILSSTFCRLGDKLLVSLHVDGKGTELGITDGTAEGTVLLKDIYPGTNSSNLRTFVPLGDKMIFVAEDGVHGLEPWITDGTEEGTHMVVDAVPGTSSSAGEITARYGMTELGNRLVFNATEISGTSLGEVWTTDGTEANTKKSYTYVEKWLGSLNGDSFYESFRKVVKVSSSTQEATVLKDFDAPGFTGGGYSYLTGSSVVNNKLLFAMFFDGPEGVSVGQELYVTDGTADGTHVLKDIYPGSGSGILSFSSERSILWHDRLYFGATDGQLGNELWSTDGTEAGTTLVADVKQGPESSFPSFFTELDNKLFFVVNNGPTRPEFWQSDGTAEGTTFVFGFFDDGTTISTAAKFRGELFLSVRRVNDGWQLWKTNGTPGGTSMVKQFNASNDYLYQIQRFIVAGDRLFFIAHDEENGREVWTTDGTIAGTKILDVTPGPISTIGDPYSNLFEGVDDLVYFAGPDALWRTAGTMALTEKAWEGLVLGFKKLNDQFYFFPRTKEYGVELFVTPFTKFNQDLIFGDITDKAEGGEDFTLSASATSGMPVAFTTTPSGRVSITGNTVKILKPGSVTLTANQSGNKGVAASQKSHTICIMPAKPIVTLKEDKGTSKLLQSSAADGNRWFLNGTAISGATGTTFEATADGNYTVSVSIDACASETSTALAITVVGLEDESIAAFFPNPVKDKLYIQWNGNAVNASVVDTKGITRLNTSFSGTTELNVADFPAGFYVLRLTAGDKQVIRKFIKE